MRKMFWKISLMISAVLGATKNGASASKIQDNSGGFADMLNASKEEINETKNSLSEAKKALANLKEKKRSGTTPRNNIKGGTPRNNDTRGIGHRSKCLEMLFQIFFLTESAHEWDSAGSG